jgi:hypothetical protein
MQVAMKRRGYFDEYEASTESRDTVGSLRTCLTSGQNCASTWLASVFGEDSARVCDSYSPTKVRRCNKTQQLPDQRCVQREPRVSCFLVGSNYRCGIDVSDSSFLCHSSSTFDEAQVFE